MQLLWNLYRHRNLVFSTVVSISCVIIFLSIFDSDEGERKAEVVTSSDEEETAQEKKLRLAKEYLANLEQEGTDTLYGILVALYIN